MHGTSFQLSKLSVSRIEVKSVLLFDLDLANPVPGSLGNVPWLFVVAAKSGSKGAVCYFFDCTKHSLLSVDGH